LRLNYTYWVQESASHSCSRPPAVQLNSIFSAKTDPSENPEKNPGFGLFKTVINEEKRDMRMKCKLKFILYASNIPSYISFNVTREI
jgi:hypothetical protein